jgi:single-strand DNA-binding protein
MNRIQLIGNLGKKPELKRVGGGNAVLSFSLAVTKSFKKQTSTEWEQTTTWFNIVVWGKKAETLSKILDKGSKVFVEGEVRQNKYTDKNGVERNSFDVHAEVAQLLAKVDRQESSPAEPSEDDATGGGMLTMNSDEE